MKIEKIAPFFFLSIFLLIALMFWQFKIQQELFSNTEYTELNHQQVESLDKLLLLTLNIETGVRGFILTKNERYLTPYEESIADIEDHIESVRALFAKDKDRSVDLDELVELVQKRIRISKSTIHLKDSAQIIKKLDEGKVSMDRIREIIKAIIRAESDERTKSIAKGKNFANSINLFTTLLSLGIFFFMLITGHRVRQEVRKRASSEKSLRLNLSYLKTLTASIPSGIIALDPQGVVAFTNERAALLLSTPSEEILGKKFQQYLKIESQDTNHFEQAIHSGLRFEKELQLNSQYYVRLRLAPLTQDDEVLGAVITLQDATKEKDIREELRAEKDTAVMASMAKSQFLSQMSHEIRTPLNAIVGMSEMLLQSELEQDTKNYAEVLHDASQNLLRLVNDILDLSKIESGKLELEQEPFDLKELLVDCIKLTSFKASEKGLLVQLVKNIDHTLFIGDSLRIRQICMNLLSNALKFTDKGYVRVKIEQIDQSVVIHFHDSGRGIAEHKLDSIFEKYVQEDASISKNYGGTGLGLSISREMARLMGGDIKVSSALGMGSRFSVTLRLEPFRGVLRQSHTKNWKLQRMKVLLVDDNPDNRFVVRSYLKAFPIEITEAQDGIEAIEKATRENFDLIFMDMHMPRMDGLEATRELKSHNLKTPIVALTAFALKSEIDEIKKSGCIEYLSKPITRNNLLKFLSRFQEEYLHLSSEDSSTISETELADEIDELIPQYLANRRAEIPHLELWLSQKDYQSLRAFNHKLKGTALSYKQRALDQWAQQMSEALKREDESLIQHLIADYKKQVSSNES